MHVTTINEKRSYEFKRLGKGIREGMEERKKGEMM